ncbi:MAG: hypothetical protein IPK76_18140 [Lewinellaceae bacterium]|nr:hypothetical protein [Lewinellaceae bacterium]
MDQPDCHDGDQRELYAFVQMPPGDFQTIGLAFQDRFHNSIPARFYGAGY